MPSLLILVILVTSDEIFTYVVSFVKSFLRVFICKVLKLFSSSLLISNFVFKNKVLEAADAVQEEDSFSGDYTAVTGSTTSTASQKSVKSGTLDKVSGILRSGTLDMVSNLEPVFKDSSFLFFIPVV